MFFKLLNISLRNYIRQEHNCASRFVKILVCMMVFLFSKNMDISYIFHLKHHIYHEI